MYPYILSNVKTLLAQRKISCSMSTQWFYNISCFEQTNVNDCSLIYLGILLETYSEPCQTSDGAFCGSSNQLSAARRS